MTDYLLGLYEKALPSDLSWEDKLNIVKDNGFDFLEISIDETDLKLSRLSWNHEELSTLERAMQRTNCFIRTMCLSGQRRYPLGSRDILIQKKSLQIVKNAIDLCWRLGIRIIQIPGYDVYYEQGRSDTRNYFYENLIRCVEMAATKGITLGFETMETPFMDTMKKTMHYIRKIDSPYLQIYPDIGNLTNASKKYQIDFYNDLEKSKGHIIAAHLKETKPGIYRNMRFGDGHTDFAGSTDCLLSLGVRIFTAEFWYQGEEEWVREVQYASKYLRSRINSSD